MLSSTGLWSVHDKIDLKKIIEGKPKHQTPQATQQTNNNKQTQQQKHKIPKMGFGAPETTIQKNECSRKTNSAYIFYGE